MRRNAHIKVGTTQIHHSQNGDSAQVEAGDTRDSAQECRQKRFVRRKLLKPFRTESDDKKRKNAERYDHRSGSLEHQRDNTADNWHQKPSNATFFCSGHGEL